MSTLCQIYLHPAVAGNPAVIRQIHKATGLRAVAGSNPHAPTLTPSASKPAHPGVLDSLHRFFERRAAPCNPSPGPDGGDVA